MVKVIQERHCKPGKEQELKKLLEEITKGALQRDGYWNREVLRSVDDPSVWLVISSWNSAEQWKGWRNTAERQEIISRIEPLLVEPARETIFELAR